MKELIAMIQSNEKRLLASIGTWFRKYEFMSRDDFNKLFANVLSKYDNTPNPDSKNKESKNG